jgi:uncharacterized protein (TIGR03118 family)
MVGAPLAALIVATLFAALPDMADEGYSVRILVSSGATRADRYDAALFDPAGLACDATGPWLVAGAGGGAAIVLNGRGLPGDATVKAPEAIGLAFNGGGGFVVGDEGAAGPARFLFASRNGVISGWSPSLSSVAAEETAFSAIDASAEGAGYTAITAAAAASGDRLYAADFRRNRIDVFDAAFRRVSWHEAFLEPRLPADFAPFNVANLGGRIYVAYARPGPGGDPVAGPGLGFVSVFDPEGRLLGRVDLGEPLNAPWGLAIAPQGFGPYSGHLLVGNTGDGRINAFDLKELRYRGPLKTSDDRPVSIGGLRALAFGNGYEAGPTTTLYFTAVGSGAGGLFGAISAP